MFQVIVGTHHRVAVQETDSEGRVVAVHFEGRRYKPSGDVRVVSVDHPTLQAAEVALESYLDNLIS